MKKITAYIFILLANIILLVHAVTFHHHHDQVCNENTHCQSSDVACNHGSTAGGHQHGAEDCGLEQAVVLPSNQGKHEIDRIAHTDNGSFNSLFTVIHIESKSLIPVFFTDLAIPAIHYSYSSFIIASSGLRAPPAV